MKISESGKFRVAWPTGCIVIYPVKFFGTATLTNSNAFLKLAKQYSNNEQRNELLEFLKQERLMQIGKPRKQIEKSIEKIEKQSWGC